MWKLNKAVLNFNFGVEKTDEVETPAIVSVPDVRLPEAARADRRARNRLRATRRSQRRSGGSTGMAVWIGDAKGKRAYERLIAARQD